MLRTMFGSPFHRGARRAHVRRWRGRRPYAFVLVALAWMLGCGENVFVGNWQLRSRSDAGVDLPDAAPNEQAEYAEAARANKRDKPVKDHSRLGPDKAAPKP